MPLKKKGGKGKGRKSRRRSRATQEMQNQLIQNAPVTPPYVMYHLPRGVNKSGGRHIPETEVGYRMVDKRVVVGVDRYLVNNELVISAGYDIDVRIADIMTSVAWTNQKMHDSWSKKTQLPGSNMEVSCLEVMQPDLKSVSAMMGSTPARGLASFSRAGLTVNPSQSGCPDLLPTSLYNDLMKKYRAGEKILWSRIGRGIEMKGTCGTVIVPELDHPYGETRINMLRKFTFQGHHDGNTVILGVLWDHIVGVPQIVGVFYGNNFKESDFTKPKNLGPRSTPSYPLNRAGLNKLVYVCVLNDRRYLERVSHILPYCGLGL